MPNPSSLRPALALLGLLLALALALPSAGAGRALAGPPATAGTGRANGLVTPVGGPVVPDLVPTAGGEGRSGRRIEPGVVLVRFKASARPDRVAGVLAGAGAAEEGEIRAIRVRKLRVPPGHEDEVVAKLRADPDVEFAEVSSYLQVLAEPPNDPYYPYQWNLPKANLPAAWDVTRGDPSVVVAVLDTGFDWGHPDGPANIRFGGSYPDDGYPSWQDPNGHGTHVAGIVAANTNNGQGVAGVAPGATVLAIRVCYSNGSCSIADIAAGLAEAADAGARVVNLSLGCSDGTGCSLEDLNTLSAAVSYAQGKGALVVAAAGNFGNSGNPTFYPAAFPGVLAIAATTWTDDRADYSEYGSYVGVAAPGGDPYMPVDSLCPGGTYCYRYGTSMAAPHVTGVAALVMSARRDLSSSSVAGIIKSTADPIGQVVPNQYVGYGRIDAAAALRVALGMAPRSHLPMIVR